MFNSASDLQDQFTYCVQKSDFEVEKASSLNLFLDPTQPERWNDFHQSLPEYSEILKSFKKTIVLLSPFPIYLKKMKEIYISFLSHQIWEINENFLKNYQERRKELVDEYLRKTFSIHDSDTLIENFEDALKTQYYSFGQPSDEYYRIGKFKIAASKIASLSGFFSIEGRTVHIVKHILLAYEATGCPLLYTREPIIP